MEKVERRETGKGGEDHGGEERAESTLVNNYCEMERALFHRISLALL